MNINKYQAMFDGGESAEAAYAESKADGLNLFSSIRMLRDVYKLSLEEAKKIGYKVDTGEGGDVVDPALQKSIEDILDEYL